MIAELLIAFASGVLIVSPVLVVACLALEVEHR